jgi:hypothetical protein
MLTVCEHAKILLHSIKADGAFILVSHNCKSQLILLVVINTELFLHLKDLHLLDLSNQLHSFFIDL